MVVTWCVQICRDSLKDRAGRRQEDERAGFRVQGAGFRQGGERGWRQVAAGIHCIDVMERRHARSRSMYEHHVMRPARCRHALDRFALLDLHALDRFAY